MFLGYAIIQLPELVPSLILFAKSQIIKNRKFSSAKSAIPDRTKKSYLLRQGNEKIRNEKILDDEYNLFKPSNYHISVGRPVQCGSILERVKTLESKFDEHGKKLDEILAFIQTK